MTVLARDHSAIAATIYDELKGITAGKEWTLNEAAIKITERLNKQFGIEMGVRNRGEQG